MQPWLIVTAIVVVGLLLFMWRHGRRPYRYKNVEASHLKRFMETLLNRGYQGGLLILETKDNGREGRFLQFAKYIHGDGHSGLEFGFPLAPWSRPYYAALRKNLETDGVKFRLEDTGRQDTEQFLLVDLGKDMRIAQRVADIAIETVFGSKSSTFQAHYENISLREETIGR
jgi:hypothetical protein